MKQEEIKTPLGSRKTQDLYVRFRTDLQEALNPGDSPGVMGLFKSALGVAQSIYASAGQLRAAEGEQPSRSADDGRFRAKGLLTIQNAELGLLLINEMPSYRDPGSWWTNMDEAPYNSDRYNRIEELLGAAEWDDEANYALLIYFLGAEKAACARHAWKQIRHQVYQRGNSRRLFRSPGNKEIYRRNQINFIIRIIPQVYTRQNEHLPHAVAAWGAEGSHAVQTVAAGEVEVVAAPAEGHGGAEGNVYYDLTLAEQIRYNHLAGGENPDLFHLWSAALDMWNAPVFKQLEEILSCKERDGKITGSILKALVSSDRQDAWGLVEKLLFAARLPKKLQQIILEALNETSPGAIRYLLRVVVDRQLSRLSLVVKAADSWVGLGWENELETTVRSFLGKALLYLENPDALPGAVKMENNAIVYMALWAQGVLDVEETLPTLRELYKKGDVEKRSLALLFAEQTAHYRVQMPLFIDALEDTEIPPLACAVNFFFHSVSQGHNDRYYNKIYPELFGKLESVYRRIEVREKTYDGFLFPWAKIHFSRKKVIQTMICLAGDQQDRLQTILYFFGGLDPRGKKEMISLLLSQKDEAICPIIGLLLLGGHEEQRLSGLEILRQLKKNYRLVHECETWIASFGKRSSLSPEEEKLLRALRRPRAGNEGKGSGREKGIGTRNESSQAAPGMRDGAG